MENAEQNKESSELLRLQPEGESRNPFHVRRKPVGMWGCSDIDLTYRKQFKVGQGSYGEVYKAATLSSGEYVAIKKMNIAGSGEGFPLNAMREIHYMIMTILEYLQISGIVKIQERRVRVELAQLEAQIKVFQFQLNLQEKLRDNKQKMSTSLLFIQVLSFFIIYFSSQNPKTAQEMSCKHCNSLYDRDEHLPIRLPCGHIFCLRCLLVISGETGVICPSVEGGDCNVRIEKSIGENLEDILKAFYAVRSNSSDYSNPEIVDGASNSDIPPPARFPPANPPPANPPPAHLPPLSNPPPAHLPPLSNPPHASPPLVNPPHASPPLVNPPRANPPRANPPPANLPRANPPPANPPPANPPSTNSMMDDDIRNVLLLYLNENQGPLNAPRPEIKREEIIISDRTLAHDRRNFSNNPRIFPANRGSILYGENNNGNRENNEGNRERQPESKDCLSSFWNCFSCSSLLALDIIICEVGFIICEIFFAYHIKEYSNSDYFTSSILCMIFLPIYEIFTLLSFFLMYNTCKCTRSKQLLRRLVFYLLIIYLFFLIVNVGFYCEQYSKDEKTDTLSTISVYSLVLAFINGIFLFLSTSCKFPCFDSIYFQRNQYFSLSLRFCYEKEINREQRNILPLFVIMGFFQNYIAIQFYSFSFQLLKFHSVFLSLYFTIEIFRQSKGVPILSLSYDGDPLSQETFPPPHCPTS